jgi:hypothetical protein
LAIETLVGVLSDAASHVNNDIGVIWTGHFNAAT